MRKSLSLLFAFLLLLPGPTAAAATAAEAAYEQARLDYFALRKDEKRRQWRHHWQRVIAGLDGATKRLRGDARCKALFNAGRAWHDLSEISYLQSDREEAIARYRRLADDCPRSSLADDALFHMAELQRKRDPAAARSTLDRLLASHPKGDMAAAARSLRAELPPPARGEKRVAAAPKGGAQEKGQEKRPATPAQAKNGAKQAAAVPPASPPAARDTSASSAPTMAKTETERTPAASPAGRPDEATAAEAELPGSRLPSAADILAALDAKGADAERPEDVALSEDLRRDALARQQGPLHDEAALDPERLAAIEKATGGEIPLSLAAGLKVRRVVIDPGHGGKDTGAIGSGGTKEKDLTLAIARRLKRHLEGMGLEVLLTREEDVYLDLEERTRFANEKQADLFLSIHVNAAENRKARGIETYTLNLNSDRYAMRLAARENASSSKRIGDLQFILADLATKANTDDSIRLARLVQSELVSRLRKTWGDSIRDLG